MAREKEGYRDALERIPQSALEKMATLFDCSIDYLLKQ